MKKKIKLIAISAVFSVLSLDTSFMPAYALQDDTEQSDSGENLLPPENAIQHNSVVLRLLDKITARVTEVSIEIGSEHRFGTLSITPRYCRTRPPVEPPETFAYLEIDDVKHNGQHDRVFEGWMIASSPALNALEHPVYDVWVIKCIMVAPDTVSSN
ncbi:DUF2155 domain-containing protein [Kordiimonas pumila]|uniref:DUF2155 domain-containing protein n=1 Tax=Kordiimonas pumila TaxID=2161677 RepID=A0ABV7D1Q3_9PROT|nr:DUF2155 domain-containing protein [Kordiimonas pumila]